MDLNDFISKTLKQIYPEHTSKVHFEVALDGEVNVVGDSPNKIRFTVTLAKPNKEEVSMDKIRDALDL